MPIQKLSDGRNWKQLEAGFYWFKTDEQDEWCIVRVDTQFRPEIYFTGNELSFDDSDFEGNDAKFGPQIASPKD